MSRIGNAIITIPKEVTAQNEGGQFVVKGPKGELRLTVPQGIVITVKDGVATVTRDRNDKPKRALHGNFRAIVANALEGVTKGWTKTLELSGVGYRASVNGTSLVLTVGFSHPVTITPPDGIAFSLNEGKVAVSGIDKQMVGEIAAKVRATKKPEPYKGKGIKYEGEYIRKKAGKAKSVGGAPGATK